MSATSRSKNLAQGKSKNVQNAYVENNFYNLGIEIEDLVFDEDLNPLTRQQAHQTLENIAEDLGEDRAKLKRATVEGETVPKKVEILDSPFVNENGEDEFLGEIDFDLNPRQSEIATPVVHNPVDALFEAERMQRIRDRNLPEGYRAHAVGLTPESMFPDIIEGNLNLVEFARGNFDVDEKEDRMLGERYKGLKDAHGKELYAMGSTGSIQTNAGTGASTPEEADQQFFKVYDGGDKASIMSLARSISAKSNSDRIHLVKVTDDGEIEYEPVVESGRDFSYDVFVNSSEAAERPGGTRWEELSERLGGNVEIQRNDNYGFIEKLSELDEEDTTLDVISNLLEMNKIMPAEDVRAGEIYIEEDQTLADLLEMDEAEEYTVFFDHEAENGTLKEILDNGEYKARFLVNGEMKDGFVRHDRKADEWEDLFSGYVDMHDTMVRADDANKMGGVEEWRSSSNNFNKNETILSDIGALRAKDEIQELFQYLGVEDQNEGHFRDQAALEGMSVQLPEGTTLEDTTYMGLLPEFVKGIKKSFKPDELAYTFELAASSYEDSAVSDQKSFREFMDDAWDGIDDFVDWSIRYHDTVPGKQGWMEYSEWSDEYEEFIDWTAETYVSDMVELYENGTPNERITELANEENPQDAYKSTARTSA